MSLRTQLSSGSLEQEEYVKWSFLKVVLSILYAMVIKLGAGIGQPWCKLKPKRPYGALAISRVTTTRWLIRREDE